MTSVLQFLTDKQKHRQYVAAKTWLWPPTHLMSDLDPCDFFHFGE